MAHYSILNKADILEILKPYSIFNIKKFQILEYIQPIDPNQHNWL